LTSVNLAILNEGCTALYKPTLALGRIRALGLIFFNDDTRLHARTSRESRSQVIPILNQAPRQKRMLGRDSITPRIFFFASALDRSGQLHAPFASLSGQQPPVPTEQKGGQGPLPVWKVRRTDKSLAPGGKRHFSDVQPPVWSLY